MALRIEPAQLGDRRPIIDVLTTAFRNDPPMVALIPDGRRRAENLRRLYGIDVSRKVLGFGGSLVARDGEKTVGVALAFPPGTWKGSILPDVFNLATYLRAFGRRSLMAVDVERTLHKAHPAEPHVYLLYLGAREPGRGVGGALLTALAEQADRDGLPMYLESSTPASARLYARHGFQTVGEIDHPVGHFTPMWRPASPSVTG